MAGPLGGFASNQHFPMGLLAYQVGIGEGISRGVSLQQQWSFFIRQVRQGPMNCSAIVDRNGARTAHGKYRIFGV